MRSNGQYEHKERLEWVNLNKKVKNSNIVVNHQTEMTKLNLSNTATRVLKRCMRQICKPNIKCIPGSKVG